MDSLWPFLWASLYPSLWPSLWVIHWATLCANLALLTVCRGWPPICGDEARCPRECPFHPHSLFAARSVFNENLRSNRHRSDHCTILNVTPITIPSAIQWFRVRSSVFTVCGSHYFTHIMEGKFSKCGAHNSAGQIVIKMIITHLPYFFGFFTKFCLFFVFSPVKWIEGGERERERERVLKTSKY